MRADRLISTIMLLQAHDRLTSRELAERLEVSERTVYRDMEALSIAGIPVYAERGKGGGWALLDDYRTTLTGLNLAEIQTLFLNTPTQLLDDLGLKNTAEIALLKLLSSLPDLRQHDADFLSQRIHIDVRGWQDFHEDNSYLPILQEALWRDCQIKIHYERSDGSLRERIVSPLGLVAKGSVWYLIAAVDGDVRTYRVSRLKSVNQLPKHAERPPEFNLAEFWSQSTADFKATLPSFYAQISAHSEALPRLRYQARFVKVIKIHDADEQGWHLVDLQSDTEDEACRFVMGFGSFVKVVNPSSLQQMVVERAEAILTNYRSS